MNRMAHAVAIVPEEMRNDKGRTARRVLYKPYFTSANGRGYGCFEQAGTSKAVDLTTTGCCYSCGDARNSFTGKESIMRSLVVVVCSFLLAGCGSAYKGAIDQSGLGAGQYAQQVAVMAEPGYEKALEEAKGLCAAVAEKRQMTAAQEAQLETILGVAEGTVAGAGGATQMAQIFDAAGFGSADIGDQALIGAGVGLVTGLVSAIASGARDTASETKRVLLNCLRKAGRNGTKWTVLE